MSDIVSGVDPARIASDIEVNTNDYLLSFACLPSAELHGGPQVIWVDSGIPDATFNSVVYADFPADAVDVGIDDVLTHFHHDPDHAQAVGPCVTLLRPLLVVGCQ